MAKLSRKEKDMGKVIATMTTKSIFGETVRNIYDNQHFLKPLEEGTKESYVAGYKVITTIKFV